MGWVGLGPRIFDLPNVGLGTYFRQPNLPNNPLGQGNPSGQPYRTGTLVLIYLYISSSSIYMIPRVPVRSGWVAQRGSSTRPSRVVGLGWVGRVLGGFW